MRGNKTMSHIQLDRHEFSCRRSGKFQSFCWRHGLEPNEAGNALNFSGLRQKGQGYSAPILAIQPCDAKLVFTIWNIPGLQSKVNIHNLNLGYQALTGVDMLAANSLLFCFPSLSGFTAWTWSRLLVLGWWLRHRKMMEDVEIQTQQSNSGA